MSSRSALKAHFTIRVSIAVIEPAPPSAGSSARARGWGAGSIRIHANDPLQPLICDPGTSARLRAVRAAETESWQSSAAWADGIGTCWRTLRKQRYGFGLPRASRWIAGHTGPFHAPDSHAEAHLSNTSGRNATAFASQCRARVTQRPVRQTESLRARWAADAAPGIGIGPHGTALELAIARHAVLLGAAELTHAPARHAAR